MKTKFVVAAALTVLSASSFALELDITNNPNKAYLLGYEHHYPGTDCDVRWWASQKGTEFIMSIGDCKGISDKKMIDDMNEIMAATRHLQPRFNNFSEYYRWRKQAEEKARKEAISNMVPSPGYPVQFCLSGDMGEYFFSSMWTSFKEGWHPVYLRKNSNDSNLKRVGYWQVTVEGSVIATSDTASTVIHREDTRPCGYIRSASN